MARSGINKTLVIKAREAVIAKGENPSIDRVRVELGNTGSKATIHRYLKEIEQEQGAYFGNDVILSNQLNDLVAKLASQLKEEAEAIVSKKSESYEQLEKELTNKLQILDQQNVDLKSELEATKYALEQSLKEVESHKETLQTSALKINSLEQEVAGFQQLLNEKSEHIQSLENKHKHFRDSLAHYRESVTTQREADQRKHDEQIQQLQMENRQVSQTISIKQTEITSLNRDNARLVSEVAALEKANRASDKRYEDLHVKYNNAIEDLQSEGQQNEKNTLMTKSLEKKLSDTQKNFITAESALTTIQIENDELRSSIMKMEVEIDIKNQLLDKHLNVGMSVQE
jgi:chromosome segregation ATPase